MDWRLISAVTLAGASFSMVAFGAYTLRAADAVAPDAGRSASSLIAPTLIPLDASRAAGTQLRSVKLESGLSTPAGNGAAAPSMEYAGVQLAGVEVVSPVLPGGQPDVLNEQDVGVTLSWGHAGRKASWKVGSRHHAKFCTVLRPCAIDKKQQVAVRRGAGEEHSVPRMALMLGVGF